MNKIKITHSFEFNYIFHMEKEIKRYFFKRKNYIKNYNNEKE